MVLEVSDDVPSEYVRLVICGMLWDMDYIPGSCEVLTEALEAKPSETTVKVLPSTSLRIATYLADRVGVEILRTDELDKGQWVYAVAVADTDFWLEAFPTEDEAIAYCNLHHLPLLAVPA